MTVKDDAIELAQELNALESEYGIPTGNSFHVKLRAALHRHKDVLGLSDADIDEVEAGGQQARGGTPKEQ